MSATTNRKEDGHERTGHPTIVLVHGGFADASFWAPVIKELQAHDLPVLAPPNPLRGLAHDAEYIASYVNQIDGPVILVGHSYGGAVISVAGANTPNAVGLVYVAAFVLDEGESFGEIFGQFGETPLVGAVRPSNYGNRSVAAQQQLRDDWHDIADMPAGDTRTQAEICAALTPRFIQCPTAWTAAGVARGGPAAPGNSRHNVGQAADLRLSFGAVTGNFDETTSQRRDDIRSHFTALVDQVDNLCESPSVDPGHIELPYKTADEVAPRCHFVDAARAFQKKKRRARRLPKGPAVAKAFAAANKFGRRFVGRNAEDIYLDWAVGRCKKGRRSTLCKLDILGEAAHQFTCHATLVVTGSKRLRVDVLGRKTRCR